MFDVIESKEINFLSFLFFFSNQQRNFFSPFVDISSTILKNIQARKKKPTTIIVIRHILSHILQFSNIIFIFQSSVSDFYDKKNKIMNVELFVSLYSDFLSNFLSFLIFSAMVS